MREDFREGPAEGPWRTYEELLASEVRYRTVIEQSPLSIHVFAPDGTSLLANASWDELWNLGEGEEPEGHNVFEDEQLRATGLIPYVEEGVAGKAVTPPPLLYDPARTGREGDPRWLQPFVYPVKDEAGSVREVTLIIEDVTERKALEEASRESEERYRAVVEQTAEGIYLLDVDTRRVLEANAAFGELLGYSAEELPGTAAHDFVTQSPEELELNIRRTLEEGRRFVGERRYRRKGGSTVDVEVNVSVISYGGRRVICAAVRDVTERKRAEEETKRSERELAEAQRIARVGSWAYDVANDEGRWSDEMYRIAGFAPQEFVVTYKMFSGLVHPGDRELLREAVRGALYGHGDRRGVDYRLVRPDGRVRFLHSEYEIVRDWSGWPVRLVGTSQDVTERRALEEELERRALHDGLTGLPNRALFSDRLSQALARGEGRGGEGGGKEVAVLFMDLDNFKYVNDSLGHGAGDELLVAVAERLRKALRPEDTVARLGGDEFAMLLESVGDRSRAKRVAGRVIKALRSPFALGAGRDVFATPSIGVALGEPGRASAADLLRRADVAMYRAKRGGKARYEVFGPTMEAEAVGRLGLEHDLRRALERGEFAARYQPIVRHGGTGGWRVVGFEALLRWEHPERGLLAPSEFLPLAEELGLTVPVGLWLVGEACRRTKEWQERHPGAAPLAVGANLSARQLSDPSIVSDVEGAARGAGLSPEQVTLEVTEDAVVGEAGRPVEALRGLRDAGFLLALDDFGTGYSSLSYLRRLPIGLVKIDRSFVARLGEDGREEDEVLLSGIVGIAHGLGLLVCAEGVETEEQLHRVGALGCGLAQGYYFSRPLPAEGASALLARGLAR